MVRLVTIIMLMSATVWQTPALAFGGGLPAGALYNDASTQYAEPVLSSTPSLTLLQSFHNFALKRHQYISDQEQYHRHDHWEASLTGDCEDYALWLQQKLSLLAIDSELVWVWQQDQSHMVLLVANHYVIDNLQKKVMTLTEVNTNHPYQRVFGKWQLQQGEHRFLAQDFL